MKSLAQILSPNRSSESSKNLEDDNHHIVPAFKNVTVEIAHLRASTMMFHKYYSILTQCGRMLGMAAQYIENIFSKFHIAILLISYRDMKIRKLTIIILQISPWLYFNWALGTTKER